MKRLVIVLVVLLFVLHQDFWWWDRIDPLAFGFMPIGLTSQVVLSILTAVVFALMVKYCWPRDVNVAQNEIPSRRSGPEL
jgi:hypothetical protein